jgi:hypothetical protein
VRGGFIGNNKAAKSSSMQIFDLFHGLLYLAVTPYRNGFLDAAQLRTHGEGIAWPGNE